MVNSLRETKECLLFWQWLRIDKFFAMITLYMITSTYESYHVCLFDMVLRIAEGQNCLC